MMGTIQFGSITAGDGESNTTISQMSGNPLILSNSDTEFSTIESAVINLQSFMAVDETVVPTSIIPQYGFAPYATGMFSGAGTSSMYGIGNCLGV